MANVHQVSASAWAAINWIEREGHLGGPSLRRLRCRIATDLARTHIGAGNFRAGARWTRTATREGRGRERAAAIIGAVRSGAGWVAGRRPASRS